MEKQIIHKIIYFDKETIRNILEEKNKGSKSSKKDIIKTSDLSGEIATQIELGIPFFERLKFLFSGKLKSSFLIKKDNSTSITSTEISEFESIKECFSVNENIHLYDIENSSTFFRVAGTYLRIAENGVEGVNIKEFKDIMDSQDGYDTYKIDEKHYVRFNNTAFLSNYKRNELLATKMTIYSISIGKFNKEKFDFTKQLYRMQNLYKNDFDQTLADAYPTKYNKIEITSTDYIDYNSGDDVELFDVVYACIGYKVFK